MDDGDLVYAGEKTDDEPLTLALYSSYWRSHLLALAAILQSGEMWVPGTDLEGMRVQVGDLLACLMGVPMAEALSYPQNVWLDAHALTDLSAPRFEFKINTLQYLGGFFVITPGNLDDPIFKFAVGLQAGTFNLSWLAVKYTNRGKFRWVIDDVELDSAYDMDNYAASTVHNYVWTCGISTAVPGLHTFMLKNVGKNPSSTGYSCAVTAVWLQQTGV